MRRSLLFLAAPLFLLPAAQAHAEHWVWHTVNGGAVAYDEDSRAPDPETHESKLDTVLYYIEPRDSEVGAYHFVAERLHFQCDKHTYRWEESSVLNADGGVLGGRPDSDWTPLGDKPSLESDFGRIACTEAKPPIDGEAASLAQMILAVQGRGPPQIAPEAQAAAGATGAGPAPKPGVGPIRTAVAAPEAKPAPDEAKPEPDAKAPDGDKAVAAVKDDPQDKPAVAPKPFDPDALANALASEPAPAPRLRGAD